MKKTILSILLALASASPVLAAQVVPQGYPSEPQQQGPAINQLRLLGAVALNPVYQVFRKYCVDGGGTWVKGAGHRLNWSCLNSAGMLGSEGLPKGQKGPHSIFLILTRANPDTNTIQYSVDLDEHKINITAVAVNPPAPNNGNGAQR